MTSAARYMFDNLFCAVAQGASICCAHARFLQTNAASSRLVSPRPCIDSKMSDVPRCDDEGIMPSLIGECKGDAKETQRVVNVTKYKSMSTG